MTDQEKCLGCGAAFTDPTTVCGLCMNRKMRPEFEESIKKDTCKSCGQPLRWGEFAYEQEMCWECFRDNIRGIQAMLTFIGQPGTVRIPPVERLNYEKMIEHMLRVMGELHGKLDTLE